MFPPYKKAKDLKIRNKRENGSFTIRLNLASRELCTDSIEEKYRQVE
jgi:hypothetical protein